MKVCAPKLRQYLLVILFCFYGVAALQASSAIAPSSSQNSEYVQDLGLVPLVVKPVNYSLVIQIASLLLLLMIGLLMWDNRLKQLNKERKFLLDNVQAQIWYATDSHTFGMVNQARADFLGKKIEELEHKDMFQVLSRNAAETADRFNRQVISQKQALHTEVWGTNAAGEPRLLSIYRVPKINQKGEVEHIICSAIDITESKQAGQIILDSKETALAVSKAKSDFLANMSHEIRTPLNGMIGFTDLLKDTQLDETQKEYLQIANSAAHSLLKIVNDILDYSKIEAGSLDLDPIETDLASLMRSCISTLGPEANKKKLRLYSTEENLPVSIVIDPMRLQQILVNLLSNAIKFTDSGEVELKASFKPLDADLGVLSMSVRDTGIGISDEDAARLFKDFSQTDSINARKPGGSGLGLAISKRLSQLMGGELNVTGSPGKGCTFTLDIRLNYHSLSEETLREMDSDHHRVEEWESVSQLISPKILITDDGMENLLLMHSIISRMVPHAEIFDAPDGETAVQTASTTELDLIFMDIQMPKMNGLTATQMILKAETGRAKHVPIIAITARAMDEEIAGYLAAGMDDYLAKPIESGSLKQILQKYL